MRNDIDNSVRNDYDYDIDNSVRNDFDIDNSVRNDIDNSMRYEDAFNTDNSVHNEGSFSGNNGVINMLDGGVVNTAEHIARDALAINEGVTNNAFKLSAALTESFNENLSSAHDNNTAFLSNAIDNTLSSNEMVTAKALDQMQALSEQLTTSFNNNLTQAHVDTAQFLSDSSQANITANDHAFEQVAQLAKSTSLQGQDLIVDSATNMIKYVMMALTGGAVVVGMLFFIRGK